MGQWKIKLCGMRRGEDIDGANALRPEYIGYIFAEKSRRRVDPETAARLTARLDPGILPVGVFVNADPDLIVRMTEVGTIRAVQLHGAEDAAYIRDLKKRLAVPVIRAFGLKDEADVRAAGSCPADLVLLDTGEGGTGRVFNHGLLAGIRRPYILAGGLDPDNVAGILGSLPEAEAALCVAVDVSSGIETGGYKDMAKMAEFSYLNDGAAAPWISCFHTRTLSGRFRQNCLKGIRQNGHFYRFPQKNRKKRFRD